MTTPDSGSVYECEDESLFDKLADVKASGRKAEILKELSDAPKNTTDFAEQWDVTTEAVGHHLKQLKAEGLVEVLTPERDQYVLYGLTQTGENIVEML